MTTATGFSAIVGQKHPITLLKTLIAHGTLPHALLFTGDDGVGKKMTAVAFAMACNCLSVIQSVQNDPRIEDIDACGHCLPCKKVAGNQHPDVIRVSPLSSVIKIAQIRTLLRTLALKPNEANRRVVILSEAQTMNAQAANALLKVLEEPPDRTILVLTANNTSNLLPTVVSRCRHVRFFPLEMADIERLLAPTVQLEPDAMESVTALCQGSYTRAIKLTDRRWLHWRNGLIETLDQLIAGERSSQIRTWLAFSEELARKKDRIEESLGIVIMWLRDLLAVEHDPKIVLNKDFLEKLKRAKKNIHPKQILRQIDAVENSLTALRSNTNIRLTLDAMVLQMVAASQTAMKDDIGSGQRVRYM